MKTRPNTDIIAERAAVFAGFDACGKLAEQAASTYAAKLYNSGTSGATAIAKAVKLAQRWKRLGIGRVTDNITEFRQRAISMGAIDA